MKVFISWSGNNSKKLGETLRDWLPSVLQVVKPYFTPSDTEKGTRWNSEIAKELESSEVGILCVTRDNLHSDWVMFEAGALSKSIDKAHVCPVLFGIHNTDLTGPLKQFQTTEFDKEDFKKLVSVINNKLGENKLPVKVLDSVFEKWWPELKTKIDTIIKKSGQDDMEPVRKERDLLEEILNLSRVTLKNMRKASPSINPDAMQELLRKYIDLHDNQVAGQGGYQDTLDGLKSMKRAIEYLTEHFWGRNHELDELIEKLKSLTFECQKKEDTAIREEDIPF